MVVTAVDERGLVVVVVMAVVLLVSGSDGSSGEEGCGCDGGGVAC